MSRIEKVVVPDGEFDLRVWAPEGGGPGVLLVQEIFGVGDYMEAVAQDLVALGYVVAAPDMFWRIEPNWTTEHNEEALPKGMSMVSQFDWEKGVEDAAAALGVLKGLPEVGKVGVLGFCFGGTLAYLLAARAEVDSLVSFYGSGVPGMLEHLDAVQAPAQFHFGGDDPYIPREDVAKVERAVDGRDGMEIHVQEDGGHAFHNRKAPMFYQPEPAARAWRLTEEFLQRTLS
ncbi:dienelactone hydrolase family protein [Actinomadura madurae]|uniref:dienelactone hydrolase family protein n=1 Tax=Actinomadura madurae TaxID=1993 RepID=UPI002025DF59|nr:dienelactone hydrolase family protein [Actinomadura madurae]MCP9950874.1 dienelactone hydrolase family protein [Actinomadura madurae]MCP9967658.1 dienelactone hydrolase family protein [Actinomadura madurae]URM96398.1 dienelactone hydrolase family protein [Actinomadura madurae]URN07105.1 dienelactone hydrolase family protein [Actinomadura madurae]